MTIEAKPAAHGDRNFVLALQLVVACFLALRLWFDLAVNPMGDESYYWMWGQKLGLSYFDHPPLHAWLLRLVDVLFGWHPFSVRILTWFTLGGTLAIFWHWARRISPEAPQTTFWLTTAIYLAMPVVFLMTTISFQDHLLLFFCLLAMHFFLKFTDRWEEGGRDFRDLYFGAVALGLAVLTKYNGVFIGLGFGLFVLIRPKMRTLLKTPHLYLAALLAVAMQAPVFYWNITEGFASFRFHLTERLSFDFAHLRTMGPVDVLGVMAGVTSPFFFLALFRLPWNLTRSPFEERARAMAVTMFVTALLLMLAISLFINVFFYWNILAYAAVAIIAFRYLGRRWFLLLHLCYGLTGASLLTYNFAVKPISLFGYGDRGTPANYGWSDVGAAVAAQSKQHPDAFLAATRYSYAAQLGFALHDPEVTAFNPIRSQYDYWFDTAAHKGRNALLLADDEFGIGYTSALFRKLTLLQQVPVVRDGKPIWRFDIYLAEGFAEPPQ